MIIIGLCGGSGSGKGTVCSFFAELGLSVIDTDKVYHEMTSSYSPCLLELVDRFGEGIFNNGHLDRNALRKLVFDCDDAEVNRRDLNSITHRHILVKTKELIEKAKANSAIGVIIDAPLLFESGFNTICDICVAVIADESIRIKRIMKRDGIREVDAISRIRSQIPDSELANMCDYTICNNEDVDTLKSDVNALFAKIFD